MFFADCVIQDDKALTSPKNISRKSYPTVYMIDTKRSSAVKIFLKTLRDHFSHSSD